MRAPCAGWNQARRGEDEHLPPARKSVHSPSCMNPRAWRTIIRYQRCFEVMEYVRMKSTPHTLAGGVSPFQYIGQAQLPNRKCSSCGMGSAIMR